MHRMTENHCFIFQYMLNCYQFLYYVKVQTEEIYAHADSQQLCINDSSPPNWWPKPCRQTAPHSPTALVDLLPDSFSL